MSAYKKTVAAQQLAADPARSAFVMANAGAGKTHLLINRVARLLLAGTDPAKILCITFTKAAAAEMSERLFKVLGAWALSSDDALQAALAELEGPKSRTRDGAALAAARRLFARALETPGGLKIQTIHSFCESVLRRFPLEAGVAPGFTVLEDGAARVLLDDALNDIARRANKDATLAAAFGRLTALRNERDLRALFVNAGLHSGAWEENLARFGGPQGVIAATAAELGADPASSETEIKQAFVATLSRAKLKDAQAALAGGGKNAQKLCAAPIGEFLSANATDAQWTHLMKLFVKSDGAPRSNYGDKSTKANAPWVEPYLLALEQKFLAANEAAKASALFEDTVAYVTILSALTESFRVAKAARAGLDFDDLIMRAQKLFRDADAAWIMYKLDRGIDHILIDEAQDTSPDQWTVIEAPLREFFSGASAREAGRTFFAVGDIKQSIYSFQGADAGLFKEKELDLGKTISAAAAYENVPLTLSFRTTEPVLSFVDALFADAEAAEGLGDFPIPRHDARRTGEAGLVEIWPLTPRPDKTNLDPWDAPVDAPPENHPVRTLCDRIASVVDGWLKTETILASQGRPIAPGDIMVLVQSRGRLFDEIIRCLARKGVPVAGADRLKLLEDPAVEDLLSYARTVLTQADDLSLAEVLKSPFFGFDDDALFALAHPRPAGQTLWAALRTRADNNEVCRRAHDAIARARAIAQREGPAAFFSHLLECGAPAGRNALYARLTASSRDAIDEMMRQTLQFENSSPRSLRAFLHWFEENAGEIKREMERGNDAVRVMTVHAAKGLEANIVFLLDAQRGVTPKTVGTVIDLTHAPEIPERRSRLSVLAVSKDRDIAVTQKAREEKIRKAYEEYRRLLYVAATRARDRLYVCGVELGNDKKPRQKETRLKSWHALAEDAFDRLGDQVEQDPAPLWPGRDGVIRRLSSKQTAETNEPECAPPAKSIAPPAWFSKPAPVEAAPLHLAPSHLAGEEETTGAQSAAYSPAGAQDRYFRGRTLHRLLELLPDIDERQRPTAADRLLARLAPEIDLQERARWREEALAVLSDPAFAAVFAPGSRAEVSIAGTPKGARPGLKISGQIDRLAVRADSVLVVDYKTNRPPPAEITAADPNYIAQMAAYRALLQEIYPGVKIECALLWTYDARLMAVPQALLDHAFARYLAAG